MEIGLTSEGVIRKILSHFPSSNRKEVTKDLSNP